MCPGQLKSVKGEKGDDDDDDKDDEDDDDERGRGDLAGASTRRVCPLTSARRSESLLKRHHPRPCGHTSP